MKIVVIEDQLMMRSLVVRVCRVDLRCTHVAEAAQGAEGLELVRQTQPDILLLDLDLPDTDGLDLLQSLRTASPRTRILVLSSHNDEYTVHRVMAAEVAGFVDKNEAPAEVLCEAIRSVGDGKAYYSAAIGRTRLYLRNDPLAFTKLLSEREIELLRLFGSGLTNEDVAARLSLAMHTVRNHRRNIMGKLDVHSMPALVRYAVEKGFVRIRSPHSNQGGAAARPSVGRI